MKINRLIIVVLGVFSFTIPIQAAMLIKNTTPLRITVDLRYKNVSKSVFNTCNNLPGSGHSLYLEADAAIEIIPSAQGCLLTSINFSYPGPKRDQTATYLISEANILKNLRVDLDSTSKTIAIKEEEK
jgi:hypothetical protein